MVVSRKTVGGDWRFDHLSGFDYRSIVETTVNINSFSKDYHQPDDHTKHITNLS